VSTNTYSNYSGSITYKNTGTIAEANPTVKFDVPSGATVDNACCDFASQSAPGCTALKCTQSGTTITYAFTGSLAGGSQISLTYCTNRSSEAAATSVTVTSTSCP
jgi:chitosanase